MFIFNACWGPFDISLPIDLNFSDQKTETQSIKLILQGDREWTEDPNSNPNSRIPQKFAY